MKEFTITALLGSVVAKHCSFIIEFDRLRPALHAVLDVGADDTGSAFGAVSKSNFLFFVSPTLEQIDLFLDNIGVCANRTLKNFDVFEVWDVNSFNAE